MNELLHRSFVALFPPPDVVGTLQSVQTSVASLVRHVRWERPEMFHCTLEFLGNKSPDWLEKLAGRLAHDIVARPFHVHIDRAGCFPSPRSPKVFWLGSDDQHNAELRHLVIELRKTCSDIGHRPESEPFIPHITIGRSKGKIGITLTQKLETVTFQPIVFACSEIRVMKSTLTNTGSTYTTLFTIPLK